VSTVTLDAAPIDLLAEPADRDIPAGTTGHWGDVVRDALRVGAVGLAAESAGIARHCLELSCAYALSRRQFGEVIGQFQATKHRLADMLVLTENALAAVQLGAFALAGNGDDMDLSVAAAKATATDAAVHVVGDAIQLHGGIAITWEHDLHLYLRRAKANQHLLGHPTDHRDAIAERLLADAVKD
jgi:alkylation response protein AidB-like acyl-CoA dehydrogenase